MQLQQAAMDEAQHSEAALARLIDVRWRRSRQTWTVTATEYCARVETQRTPEALEEVRVYANAANSSYGGAHGRCDRAL